MHEQRTNKPQEIACLREVGFDLPFVRVPHTTVDGARSRQGRYQKTSETKAKAAEVLTPTGRVSGIPANWQHQLAAGLHQYRVYGSYEAPASPRRQRRIIERETRKAIAKTKQQGKR